MGELIEKLQQNGESGAYPLHMPGHKRKPDWNINPYAYDITEISGFDDLHNPNGVLAGLNGRLAARYGADEAFLSVNGSTAGVLTAISAAVKPGGKILLDRNCHRSAYNAVFLRELKTEYIYPRIDARTGITLGYSADDVDKIMQEAPDINAVCVTSPTYEGVVLDIRGIADVAHARGVPLIVDAAHGAHLGMSDYFPANPLSRGADLVIMSLHKTLPALTQTAVICCAGNRIDRAKVKKYYDIYVSSSPSYLLMASAEQCLDYLDIHGEMAFGQYSELLNSFRAKCGEFERLYLWKPDGEYDAGKIVIGTDRSGLSGAELAVIMRDRYGLEPELVSARYVLAMTSCMDGRECYERLWTALKEIDSECGDGLCTNTQFTARTWSGTRLYEAWETEGMPRDSIPLLEGVDRVAADYVFVYPPGVPWLVPGEVISREAARQIEEYKNSGIEVRGITPEGRISVLVDC